ncbi:monoamine oxidase [Crossiella equi]|uniref:Monoamine oxidase n=1 Tax=Crossiella equi TaxID=130796 RepID=A0ABS5AJY6_9PSEU|nr:NAD(P)/FAD-dependent oxidoreductase [Crossiella equi]MBP2476888.1 monoamine oxidase [Crossiella equi]
MADVIVVGAGAAGLGAARALADAGRQVLVIEARDRVGGRLWTDATSLSVPVERGAELVHGRKVSLWELIRKQWLRTKPLSSFLRRDPGSPWLPEDSRQVWDFPRGRPMEPLPETGPGEDAETYLTRIGLPREFLPLGLLGYENDLGSLRTRPAHEAAEVVSKLLAGRLGDLEWREGGDFRVLGGYAQVLPPLAKGLNVRLGAVVRRIEHGPDGVTVHTDAGAAQARQLVLTLPLGVLQQDGVEFDPPLPPERREALHAITQLPVCKVVLEFPQPVLPKPGRGFADFTANPAGVWDASEGYRGFAGQIVVTWAVGEAAEELWAMPEEQRLGQAVRTVRRIAGAPRAQAVGAVVHDWASDPFARGAYTIHPDRDAVKTIMAPLGESVFWGGVVESTVDRALDSGRAAAAQVLGR